MLVDGSNLVCHKFFAHVENPESKDAFLKRELNIILIGLIVNWTENQRRLTIYSQALSLQNKSIPPPFPPLYGKSVMKTIDCFSIHLFGC